MALRNNIISIGYSMKSPQELSPAGAEVEKSCYRITVLSSVCNLMVLSALISPTEQNFQLSLQRFPSESRPASQDSPAGFHQVHKQCTSFSFPNRVYFSNEGNPSINTSISTKYEGLHSIFPQAVRDLFPPI